MQQAKMFQNNLDSAQLSRQTLHLFSSWAWFYLEWPSSTPLCLSLRQGWTRSTFQQTSSGLHFDQLKHRLGSLID